METKKEKICVRPRHQIFISWSSWGRIHPIGLPKAQTSEGKTMSRNHLSVPTDVHLLSWWERLERIAQICDMSPHEFIQEAVQAEIVKRELRLGKHEHSQSNWQAYPDIPYTTKLQ